MNTADFLYGQNKEDSYYQVLGCDPNSSKSQIVAEYKARVKDLHPDKQPAGSDPAPFLRITKAYQVLSDEEERKKYDKYLQAGLNVSFQGWKEMHGHARVMHWGVPKKQPTLDNKQS
ncbi:DnaJ subfamily C member 12 [Balamuthia mandrillaris]